MKLDVGKTYKTKTGLDVLIWDIKDYKVYGVYRVFGTYYIPSLPGHTTKQYGRWALNGQHSSDDMFNLDLSDEQPMPESDGEPKVFGDPVSGEPKVFGQPKRFGELTMDEKIKLFVAQQEGKNIEFLDITPFDSEKWLLWPASGAFRKDYAYRVAKDLKPSTIDWDHVNLPYNYMATNADYGTEPRKTMLFAEEPWYDDETREWKEWGYSVGPKFPINETPPVSAEVFKSFVRGEQNGKFSLVARPGIILKNDTQ